MWTILSIIAVVLALVYWRGPNVVWGSVTLGLVLGLIVAVVLKLSGYGFHLSTIGKGMVLGALIGAAYELLGLLIPKPHGKGEK
jgi:hypothetical protein